MKQTALESFWNNIALKLSVEQVNEFLPEFENTKEMEKEQIIDAHKHGFSEGTCFGATTIHKFVSAEEYYNETFNTKEK